MGAQPGRAQGLLPAPCVERVGPRPASAGGGVGVPHGAGQQTWGSFVQSMNSSPLDQNPSLLYLILFIVIKAVPLPWGSCLCFKCTKFRTPYRGTPDPSPLSLLSLQAFVTSLVQPRGLDFTRHICSGLLLSPSWMKGPHCPPSGLFHPTCPHPNPHPTPVPSNSEQGGLTPSKISLCSRPSNSGQPGSLWLRAAMPGVSLVWTLDRCLLGR